MRNLKIYFGGFDYEKITYHKQGDYFIANLIMKNFNTDYHVGKYGHLRLTYLKEHKKGLYTELMLNGTLSDYFVDINKKVNKRVSDIIKQLAKAENEKYYRNGFVDSHR